MQAFLTGILNSLGSILASPFGFLFGAAALLFGGLFNGSSNESNANSVLQNSIATQPVAPAPPPITIPSPSFGGAKDQLVPHLTGIANVDGRYNPDPRVWGKVQIFPVRAARTLTEIRGNDQYLTALFSLGYGPLDISELKLGDKPIDEFDDVIYEIREGTITDDPITLYTQDVEEEQLGTLLTYNQNIVNTAGQTANRLSVDVMFPSGLYATDSEGAQVATSVSIAVEYRLSGSSDSWTLAGNIIATEATGAIVRKNLNWTVTRDLYDIRLRRLTPNAVDGGGVADLVNWSIIRAFDSATQPVVQRKDKDGNPVGTAYIALQIKATEELNGEIEALNCIAQSKLPIWDGSEWTEPQITNNPAWIYAEMLTGSWCKRPVAKSKLDTTALLALADFCDDKGYAFNFVHDQKTTVRETTNQVLSVCRSSRSRGLNGKYSVVTDETKVTPVAFFTPFNTKDFESSGQWVDQPEALNVRFVNPESKWQTDERPVFDDGYSSSTANRRETISLLGVTDSDHAWKLGRYYLAQGRLRRERYFITADVEGLKCRRGDLVLFNHDVPQFGVDAARIKTVITNGAGDVIGINLTDAVPTTLGAFYDVTIRMVNGTKISRAVIGDGTFMSQLLFTSVIPVATNPKPAAKDLVLFGGFVQCLVERIEYLQDLQSRLTLIDYAPGVFTADTGTIPPHDPQITIVPEPQQIVPLPVIASVKSDESVLQRDTDGAYVTRVQIMVEPPSLQISDHQYQTRLSGTEQWGNMQSAPVAGGEISVYGVNDGSTVDIRVRNVTRLGQTSAWVLIPNHFVVGKTTPPPTPPFLERVGDMAKFPYTADLLGQPVPKDFAGIQLRALLGGGNVWENGTIIENLTLAGQYPIALLPAGIVSLMIKAVDVAGNFSVNHRTLKVNFGDVPVANVVAEQEEAPTFSGTITGGAVDGGILLANESSGNYWTDDGNPTWTGNDNDLTWATTYDPLVYEWSYTVPSLPGGPFQLTVDLNVEGESYVLEYRTRGSSLWWDVMAGADDDPFYSGNDDDPFWNPEQPFSIFPGAINVGVEQIDFRLSIAGSQMVRGKINNITTKVDVPDMRETLESVIIGDPNPLEGNRLPISKPFQYIKTVNLTLEADDSYPDAYRVQLMDRSTLGPLVKIFDSAGVETAGRIHAEIQGY